MRARHRARLLLPALAVVLAACASRNASGPAPAPPSAPPPPSTAPANVAGAAASSTPGTQPSGPTAPPATEPLPFRPVTTAWPVRDAEGRPVVVDHGPRSAPRVALTFDSNLTDGMLRRLDGGKVDSYDNEAVVDELDRLHVPATFFLAGKWVERYPASARRIGQDPLFEVGSHSYSHRAFRMPCYKLQPLPASEMAADVSHSFDVLRAAGVTPVPLFRFPGLCSDPVALAAIAPTGVTVVGGDVASGDAFGKDAAVIVRHVLTSVQPGSIVVLHITKANAPVTAEVVAPIVDGLRGQGYSLVKVSDLLAAG